MENASSPFGFAHNIRRTLVAKSAHYSNIVIRWGKHAGVSARLLRRVAIAIVLLVALTYSLIIVISASNESAALHAPESISDLPNYLDAKDRKISNKKLSSSIDAPFEIGCRVPNVDAPRANASFVMLARNSELEDVVKSMKSMERRFNQWFNYPWVFLNDVEFDETFKKTVQQYTHSECEFGVIPSDQWNFDPAIDPDLLHEHFESQGDRTVMYGNLESYHKMCRFYSGFFFHHPLVQKRKWYWRVEPDVQFYCDITYDPFLEMENSNKKYGFTVALKELYYTVPGLFPRTKAFIRNKGLKVGSAWDFVAKKYNKAVGTNSREYQGLELVDRSTLEGIVEKNLNLRRILAQENKDDAVIARLKSFDNVRDIFEEALEKPKLWEDKVDNEEYNLCHFWTNFEIARTDLFLSNEYQEYFQYLEESGGFYKERWGDAPVHSIAVAMFLDKLELHYFRDIGYQHTTIVHCPKNAPGKQLPYVPAHPLEEVNPKRGPWYKFFRKRKPDEPARNGVGCRCECPKFKKDVEDRGDCLKLYAYMVSDNYQEHRDYDMDLIEGKVNQKIDLFLQRGGELGTKRVVV